MPFKNNVINIYNAMLTCDIFIYINSYSLKLIDLFLLIKNQYKSKTLRAACHDKHVGQQFMKINLISKVLT